MFEVIKSNQYPGWMLKNNFYDILTESQAWEISIEKWVLIGRLCDLGKLVHDDGIQTCGLCALFFFGHANEIAFLRSFQMGLDFSYMLYFKKDLLWSARQN